MTLAEAKNPVYGLQGGIGRTEDIHEDHMMTDEMKVDGSAHDLNGHCEYINIIMWVIESASLPLVRREYRTIGCQTFGRDVSGTCSSNRH